MGLLVDLERLEDTGEGSGIYVMLRTRLMRNDPAELARIDWIIRPVGWDDERESHWRGLAMDYMQDEP